MIVKNRQFLNDNLLSEIYRADIRFDKKISYVKIRRVN